MLAQKMYLIAKSQTPLPTIYRFIYLSIGVMDISSYGPGRETPEKAVFH
jgi:hypothetical protein